MPLLNSIGYLCGAILGSLLRTFFSYSVLLLMKYDACIIYGGGGGLGLDVAEKTNFWLAAGQLERLNNF